MGGRNKILNSELGKNVLMGEWNKLRFGVLWGEGKKSNFRFGEGCIIEGKEKKENFRFWAGCFMVVGRGKNQILDLGKDGCIIGGRKKNLILGLGDDIYYRGKEKMYYDTHRYFKLENPCALVHMVFKLSSTLDFRPWKPYALDFQTRKPMCVATYGFQDVFNSRFLSLRTHVCWCIWFSS